MYGEMTYKDISATARWHVIDRVSVSFNSSSYRFQCRTFNRYGKVAKSCKEKSIGLTKCSKEC